MLLAAVEEARIGNEVADVDIVDLLLRDCIYAELYRFFGSRMLKRIITAKHYPHHLPTSTLLLALCNQAGMNLASFLRAAFII